MSHQSRHAVAALATAALLPCALGVAACGGGSKSSSTQASGSDSSADSSSPSQSGSSQAAGTKASAKEIAAGEAALALYRACLAKYGVNLPASKIGEHIKQPKGVTRARYSSAREKCHGLIAGPGNAPSGTGGGDKGGKKTGTTPAQSGKINIPKGTKSVAPTHPGGSVVVPNGIGGGGKAGGKRRPLKVTPQRLARAQAFVACMRANGVNLPTPTKSRLLFIPKSVDVKSPQFQAAETKCVSRLSAH
jgi:hypothetical protein